jgi:nucleoside-diphosphate-sugar epimerase
MTERVLVTGGSGFIGSHLMAAISARGHAVVNLDIKAPSAAAQKEQWAPCDIKNAQALTAAFNDFRPTRVIHLAAKANLNGNTVADFPDNTLGTENVVRCVNAASSVELFVNTSTQYVVMPGVRPPDASYLEPYTAYGESKAVAERTVRSDCKRPWSIIRPTNIWGPRHAFFPYELWRYLELRYYVHPGLKPVRKYYGYVENAVRQILYVALAEHPADVTGKVWYIMDAAIDNAEWMNGFSIGLSGKPVRRVPLPLWRVGALIGDFLEWLGLGFPVNGDRLFRLTVNESVPEELIVPQEAEEFVSLEEGIAKSLEWYRATRLQVDAVRL